MNRGLRSGCNLLIACILVCASSIQCVGSIDRIEQEQGTTRDDTYIEAGDLQDEEIGLPSEDGQAILFLNSDEFVMTECSSLTADPSEVVSGEYSLEGRYFGTDSYTPYLYSDYRCLPLDPLETYEVTFDYRIIETPDKGFETIFYSPTAGQQDVWLPGFLITGEGGDSGTACLNNTLEDFVDYQVRWNIIGTGAISIDNIQIRKVETHDLVAALDIEATRAVINVTRSTIKTKIESRPTIPVFYAWCGSERISDCDTTDSPYSLIWTRAGLARDLGSAEPDVPQIQSYHMQADKDTLYIICLQWNYWFPQVRTLSPDSPFYLNEAFKFHIDSEYPDTLVINFEHPEWPDLMAEKALNFKRAGFDGIILDWWNNGAGNGRKERDVEAARLSIIKAIRKKVGDAFILMGNVNWNTDDPTAKYLSGVFMELWKPEKGGDYILSYDDEDSSEWTPSIERMEDLLKHWDSVLQWPKIIAFEPWKITTGDYIADRYTAANYKYAKLFAAMVCVIPENGYFLYTDNNDDWDGGDHQHAYYDFYRTDLGKPVSRMVEISKGVAYRKYEYGIVAYNRTASEIDATISRGERLRIGALEGMFVKGF
jgi:hypothetical protein